MLSAAFAAPSAFAQDYGEGYVPATRAGAGDVPMVSPYMEEAIRGFIVAPPPSVADRIKQGFGRILPVAMRWGPRLVPYVGTGVGLLSVSCAAGGPCWLFQKQSDGQQPASDSARGTAACVIPVTWGPGSSMNCGGQTIVWPLARGLHGRSVHLLYSTRGGAGSWVERTHPDQDLMWCASAALERIPGWNYQIAETLTGCAASPAYYITVKLVFGWKLAIPGPDLAVYGPQNPYVPQAPPEFDPVAPPNTDYDWREKFAEELRKPENDEVEQWLLEEARTRRSIDIALELNPAEDPWRVAMDIRVCRPYARSMQLDPDECHRMRMFVTGSDAAQARDHDARVIAQKPHLARLNYWKSTEKVAAGVVRQWYVGIPPCDTYDTTTHHCDEYPFFSTTQGYDRNYDNDPVTGAVDGNPIPDIEPILSGDNVKQGNLLSAFYNTARCNMTSASSNGQGGTPYLAIPLPPDIPIPTHFLCPSGSSG